ncbi:hypothetical protein Tco_1046327 [Tanacetum coccineum]
MFDKAFKRVNTFVDYKTELVEGGEKRAEDSTKRAGTELEQEVAKKQKIDDDQEEAEMKKLIKVVPDEEEVAIDAIPLATKPLSILMLLVYKSMLLVFRVNAAGTKLQLLTELQLLMDKD